MLDSSSRFSASLMRIYRGYAPYRSHARFLERILSETNEDPSNSSEEWFRKILENFLLI